MPTKTPPGDRNIVGSDGKKIVAEDSVIEPIVSELFKWYATSTAARQWTRFYT